MNPLKSLVLVALCLFGLAASSSVVAQDNATPEPLQTIFVIVMENHSWSQIKDNPSAPYINSLLEQGAHAEGYLNVPNLHPSEPNYLWLEAGTSFGVTNDNDPADNHQSTSEHLTTQLDNAGVAWKSYQEDISGDDCPLVSRDNYAPKHNPMIYFDDVTDNNNPQSAYCIEHVRPYSELAQDLTNDTTARYNFITPNQCHDMHNPRFCETDDPVKNGDNWLADAVPAIQASDAYQKGGVLFITWDESDDADNHIGLIVLSPKAKAGYSNTIPYTHSSLLRTIQVIFGVQPFLGDTANATDLADLFTSFP